MRLVLGVLAFVSVLASPAMAARVPPSDSGRRVPARPGSVERDQGPGPRALTLRLAEQEPIGAALSMRAPRIELPGRLGSLSLAPAGRAAARVARVIRAALGAVGSRYRWSAAGPSSFDCSGLVMWAWRHGGVDLPHNSGAQRGVTREVSRSALRPGDLLFFYRPVSHVGLYLGRGLMIHAATSLEGVVLERVRWADFVGAGRPKLGLG